MSSIRIATWNINSVRLRLDLIKKLDETYRPDILCLQETKCADDQFPRKAFRELGFENFAINGQKGYHGVATVSRLPLATAPKTDFCNKGHARHVAAIVADDIVIHNFYVPAGGDIPDPDENDKFAHKLDFLKEMTDWFKKRKGKKKNKYVLLGDLNIAPLEHDVWSHKQLLKVVSHTPVEVEYLAEVQKSHSWIDVAREEFPEPEKIFTWWSYRSPDWTKNDRGRRLDHIWVTPALEGRARDIDIVRKARSWKRPSDHVPILMTLDV